MDVGQVKDISLRRIRVIDASGIGRGNQRQASNGSVHPLVWTAIGGGVVAVAALIVGLVIESGKSGPETVAQSSPLESSARASNSTSSSAVDQTSAGDSWWQQDDLAVSPKVSQLVTNNPPRGAALDDRNQVSTSELTPQEIFKKCSPAVVRIITRDDNGKAVKSGSGFVIGGAKNHSAIVTNFHVIKAAVDIDIEFANGSTATVSQVLAENEQLDVAVLGLSTRSAGTPELVIAGGRPAVGDRVFAIGHPLSLAHSVQSPEDVSGYQELDGQAGMTYLQTTAAISKGSSGGPLLNARGQVVGVTTLYLPHGQSLNFAVPATAIEEALQNQKPREVWRGASVEREYKYAYDQLKSVLGSQHRQKSDPAMLFAHSDHPPADRIQCLRTAIAAENSVPSEFKYLVYTEIGANYSTSAYLKTIGVGWEQRMRSSIEYQQAIKYLTAAVRLNPTFASAWNALRTTHYEGGEFEKAISEADNTIKLAPYCPELYAARGECQLKLGKAADAVDDFRETISLQLGNLQAHLGLGSIYRSAGEYQLAADELETAIAIEDDSSDQTSFVTWEELGEDYFSAGNYVKALNAFQTAADKCGTIDGNVLPYLQSKILKCQQIIAARQ